MRAVSLVFAGLLALAAAANNTEKKIVCYFNKESLKRQGNGKFNIGDIDPTLCTHVIYAYFRVDNEGKVKSPDAETGNKRLDQLKNLRKLSPKTKFMVAIGGWKDGSSKFSSVAASPKFRQNLADNVAKLIKQYHLDGLDIDWRFPAQNGGSPTDKANFVKLLDQLRKRLDKDGLILSASVAATKSSAGKSYNIAQIAKRLNFINVITYNLQGMWYNKTGVNAPLYHGTWEQGDEKQLNANASIHYWIDQGAPAEKLVMGIPFFGRGFTLVDPRQNGVGAPANGRSKTGPYTDEPGTLGFNEICEKLKNKDWHVELIKEQRVSYAYREDQWIGYDDQKSIDEKADYVKRMGLGGMMAWSIDTDDFKGLCGDKYPLLKQINRKLRESVITHQSTNKISKTSPFVTMQKPTDNSSQNIISDTTQKLISTVTQMLSSEITHKPIHETTLEPIPTNSQKPSTETRLEPLSETTLADEVILHTTHKPMSHVIQESVPETTHPGSQGSQFPEFVPNPIPETTMEPIPNTSQESLPEIIQKPISETTQAISHDSQFNESTSKYLSETTQKPVPNDIKVTLTEYKQEPTLKTTVPDKFIHYTTQKPISYVTQEFMLEDTQPESYDTQYLDIVDNHIPETTQAPELNATEETLIETSQKPHLSTTLFDKFTVKSTQKFGSHVTQECREDSIQPVSHNIQLKTTRFLIPMTTQISILNATQEPLSETTPQPISETTQSVSDNTQLPVTTNNLISKTIQEPKHDPNQETLNGTTPPDDLILNTTQESVPQITQESVTETAQSMSHDTQQPEAIHNTPETTLIPILDGSWEHSPEIIQESISETTQYISHDSQNSETTPKYISDITQKLVPGAIQDTLNETRHENLPETTLPYELVVNTSQKPASYVTQECEEEFIQPLSHNTQFPKTTQFPIPETSQISILNASQEHLPETTQQSIPETTLSISYDTQFSETNQEPLSQTTTSDDLIFNNIQTPVPQISPKSMTETIQPISNGSQLLETMHNPTFETTLKPILDASRDRLPEIIKESIPETTQSIPYVSQISDTTPTSIFDTTQKPIPNAIQGTLTDITQNLLPEFSIPYPIPNTTENSVSHITQESVHETTQLIETTPKSTSETTQKSIQDTAQKTSTEIKQDSLLLTTILDKFILHTTQRPIPQVIQNITPETTSKPEPPTNIYIISPKNVYLNSPTNIYSRPYRSLDSMPCETIYPEPSWSSDLEPYKILYLRPRRNRHPRSHRSQYSRSHRSSYLRPKRNSYSRSHTSLHRLHRSYQ